MPRGADQFDPARPSIDQHVVLAQANGSRARVVPRERVVDGVRVADRVELTLDSTAPWRPGPLPLVMRIVTRVVPVFRAWPQTYRWRAVIALGASPTLTSRWERTGTTRDGSYGRVMRVPR